MRPTAYTVHPTARTHLRRGEAGDEYAGARGEGGRALAALTALAALAARLGRPEQVDGGLGEERAPAELQALLAPRSQRGHRRVQRAFGRTTCPRQGRTRQ